MASAQVRGVLRLVRLLCHDKNPHARLLKSCPDCGSTNGTVRTSCRRPTRAVRRVSHWLPELTHIPMSGRLRTGGHRLRIPSHLLCEVPLRAGAWSEAGSSSDQPTTARG